MSQYFRILATIVAGIGAFAAAGVPCAEAGAVQGDLTPHRTLVTTYCAACHNERVRAGGLVLDTLSLERAGDAADTWEKVVRKLRTGAMPPVGRPRPAPALVDDFLASLESALDAAATANPNPGRPASIHRLNRTEYRNAMRDLFALEIDADALLPPDDSGFGFDNIAEVLSVSPGLLDRYMSAATKIARLALGDPRTPTVAEYTPPTHLRQDARVSEALPFGSRGGMAIRHVFPRAGEYLVKVRLQRDSDGNIMGLARPHALDVRVAGERVALLTVGQRFADGQVRRTFNDYEQHADDALDVRFVAPAGPATVGVTFVPTSSAVHARVDLPRWPTRSLTFNTPSNRYDVDPAVSSVTIEAVTTSPGPAATASRREILVCRPIAAKDEAGCAHTIVSRLARRAYRRPVTKADVDALLTVYREGRKAGDFETGIELALRGMLISPSFLFRVERDPVGAAPGTPYRVTDVELASRLSFFLWSSIPDEPLLALAERGRLRQPAVLARQVQRMLADARSIALVDNFATQWLLIRGMRTVNPQNKGFPDFDDSLREAFQRETHLFLESQLREDRSVMELLTATYTFLNELLAKHYEIPHVYGSHFRRVTFPDDRRGGLLGHASILTVTSYATRTSPTRRGKWMLENILGAPPPAPPANVPDLKETGEEGKPASVRERMEQHRKNPACAGCHASMDPLGFALEQFDAIGRWRPVNDDDRTPIDSSGALPGGVKFEGAAGLRKALAETYRTAFVRTLTEKLVTYALGRGTEYYDAPVIRRIVRDAAGQDYRWSAIIQGIVASAPFQMRRTRTLQEEP